MISDVQSMLYFLWSYLQYDSDNLPYEKVGKNEPVCIADEVPFEIPESWEWARLKDLTIKEIKRTSYRIAIIKQSIDLFENSILLR